MPRSSELPPQGVLMVETAADRGHIAAPAGIGRRRSKFRDAAARLREAEHEARLQHLRNSQQVKLLVLMAPAISCRILWMAVRFQANMSCLTASEVACATGLRGGSSGSEFRHIANGCVSSNVSSWGSQRSTTGHLEPAAQAAPGNGVRGHGGDTSGRPIGTIRACGGAPRSGRRQPAACLVGGPRGRRH